MRDTRLAAALAVLCLGAALCSVTQQQQQQQVQQQQQQQQAAGRAARSPASARRRQRPWTDVEYDAEDEHRWEPAPRRRGGAAGGATGDAAAHEYSHAAPLDWPLGLLRGWRGPVLLLPLRAPAAHAAPAASRFGKECNSRSEAVEYVDDYEPEDEDHRPPPRPRRPSAPRRRPAPAPAPAPAPSDDFLDEERDEPRRPPLFPSYVHIDRLDQPVTSPPFAAAASSEELLAKFRAQTPLAPRLPPALLSEHDLSERMPRPDDHAAADAQSAAVAVAVAAAPAVAPPRGYLPVQPPSGASGAFGAARRDPARPRLARSLLLRGELTVPRADYTEAYTAWWDAASGAARVDFYGGATSTFRTVRADGSVERLEMRVDRSGEEALRRCGRAAPLSASPADRAPPALPDLDLFSFAGYVTSDGERAERWRHTLSGGAGELGAARGEALTFRHELLLRRTADDGAVPIRYSVSVDSSVLGADCDGYEHRYLDVRERDHDPELFTPDTDELCDAVERLDGASREHLSRLEPLREFTLPHRDPRYDDAIESFKAQYGRRYADAAEEALRKNLLMQHVRFTRAGNREGATFELAVNFLGDRLDAELDELLGVRAEPERGRAETFPHARAALRREEAALPARFDWRPRGAVSPVRYQGSCASCWAFAVAGAVEGALFVRTRRLTPLSEKCLVDCAHPFGGNGCRGTWPSHAYDYVKSRGLPALADYPPYEDKVERCAEQSARPVTRISAHVNVTANSVAALKVAVGKHAPTVVIVDAKAKSFVFYKRGVLYDDRCGKAGARLNHAVLAVGWGERRGEPHFVLKNSWSEAWGERGYVRVQARANTCGVLAKPSYPRLERADVLRDAR